MRVIRSLGESTVGDEYEAGSRPYHRALERTTGLGRPSPRARTLPGELGLGMEGPLEVSGCPRESVRRCTFRSAVGRPLRGRISGLAPRPSPLALPEPPGSKPGVNVGRAGESPSRYRLAPVCVIGCKSRLPRAMRRALGRPSLAGESLSRYLLGACPFIRQVGRQIGTAGERAPNLASSPSRAHRSTLGPSGRLVGVPRLSGPQVACTSAVRVWVVGCKSRLP